MSSPAPISASDAMQASRVPDALALDRSAPAAPPPDAEHHRADAMERLLLSRQRMRSALVPSGAARGPSARAAQSVAAWPVPGGVAASGATGWRAQPAWLLFSAVLGRWWRHHPLSQTASLAASAGNVALRPLARKHPLALVAGAAVLGAALAWARPWRLRLPSVLVAGLAPQLLRAGLDALTRHDSAPPAAR